MNNKLYVSTEKLILSRQQFGISEAAD